MSGDAEEVWVDKIAGDMLGNFDLYTRFRERADANATFGILAKVMSMMLVRDRGDKARFAPLVEYAGGSTSFTTAQLLPEDIKLLRGVSSTNPAIRARVNDVLWEHTSGKERVDHVHDAVDAYLELAEKVEWHDADDLLHRALELASRFQGSDSGERKKRIHDFARAAIDKGASSPGQLLHLCELLRASATGSEDKGAVLGALQSARGDAASARSFGLERNLIVETQAWLDDDELIQDLSRDVAMLWVDEAAARLDGEARSAFVASSFLEKAVQKLRAIPRKHRLRLNVDEQIASLRARMRTLGEEAVDEMQAFESEGVSLDVLAADARAAVAGRTATDALMRFAKIAALSTEAADRQTAEEVLEGSFARLFPTTSLTRDGRVADKSGQNEAVDRQMADLAHHRRIMGTLGQILPALRTMRAEHSLSRSEFAALAYASAIVPPGQEQLFASGLYAGWNLDTDAAVHILVPRMEALVRHHLKSAGVITTHLEGGGIEDEISLPALLDKPEAAGVFGADLIYELRGVYAGRFGSNLRHDVAHGFVMDSNRGSVLGIYAWWLTLRIVTVPFWNQAAGDAAISEEAEQHTSDTF